MYDSKSSTLVRALKEGHLYCHDLLRWSWCGGLRVSAWPWWTETWTLCSWRLLLDRSSPSTSCRYSPSPLRAKGWASSSGWGLFSYDDMMCDRSSLCGGFVNELCVSVFFHQFLLLNVEEVFFHYYYYLHMPFHYISCHLNCRTEQNRTWLLRFKMLNVDCSENRLLLCCLVFSAFVNSK